MFVFLDPLHDGFEVAHVAMLVDSPVRLGQANSVDDTPVVQLIAHYDVTCISKLRNEARIGCEARLVDQRRLGFFERGKPSLQFHV
jgi:hypothetical protein